jgi:small-conductance mechanosensitive channel
MPNENFQQGPVNQIAGPRSPQKRSSNFTTIAFMPSDITFQHQNTTEYILLFLRQHKIVLVPPIFWTLVLAMVPPILGWLIHLGTISGFTVNFGIPVSIWSALTIFWYFWIFAYLFQSFLSWYFNVYVMTNERLIDFDFSGVLAHGADETNLTNIETAESAIGGLWGTVFNMGIITVRTAADKNNFTLDNIPDPARVRDFIMDYVVSLGTVNKP